MDKLKYIKLEQEDGTYSDSIPLSVDSDHVDINGNTLTNELNNKASNSDVNLKVSNLQSQIAGLASGSPLVASSISGMTDTTRVYVNTSDGNWYYYNGTQWAIGGIYQSTTYEPYLTLLADKGYDRFTDYVFEKGTLNNATGANYNYSGAQAYLQEQTKRSTTYLNLTSGETYYFYIVDPTLYYYRFAIYSSTGTFKYLSTFLYNEPYEYTANENEKIRIVFGARGTYGTDPISMDTAYTQMLIYKLSDFKKQITNVVNNDSNLNLIIDKGYKKFTDYTLEKGGISASNGTDYTYKSTDGIYKNEQFKRTSDYLDLIPGKTYTFDITNSTLWMYRLVYYRADGTFKSAGNFLMEPFTYTANENEKIRLVFGPVGDTAGENPISLTAAYNNLLIYTPTDLETSMIALDSKVDSLDSKVDSFNTKLTTCKDLFCIMTYNVGNWYIGSGTNVPASKLEKFYNLQNNIIKRYNPDILCLQEYWEYFSPSVTAQSLLSKYYDNILETDADTKYNGKSICSNRELFDESTGYYVHTDGVGRNYLKAYTYLNGRKVCLITTHFSVNNVTQVGQQIDELLDIIENEEYVIICVDTNVLGDSENIAKFTTAGYNVANTGQYITCGTWSLDNIITSDNIDFDYRMVDLQKENLEEGSDHYPFILYFKIK